MWVAVSIKMDQVGPGAKKVENHWLRATYDTPGVFSDLPISIHALDKVRP